MNIPKIVHESWHEILQPLFDDLKMGMVLQEVSKTDFYPKKEDVFRVFAMPLDKVRVVILGQDPYPNGEATGLAFGVKTDRNTPSSLIVIKNEIANSIYKETSMFEQTNYPDIINWKTLEHWWKQGILLLNTALTVEKGKSKSHSLYWQWFTRTLVNKISSISSPPIWLLWGTVAQSCKSYIKLPRTSISNTVNPKELGIIILSHSNENLVLESPHPVAESYNPAIENKFTGCNHFRICNKILDLKGEKRILW